MESVPPSLFIVDDDPSFGKSLKRMLNGAGFTAECFESAQAFLDSVPSAQKGIVLVDLHMPEIDGFSLMGMMHDMGYSMPVIAITGQTWADSRDIAMQLGAVGFLQKPFHKRSLLALIESQT